jgi:hypothetical protein
MNMSSDDETIYTMRTIWGAIKNRRLIRFYYESISSKKKGFRIIEPYIIGIYKEGNKNTYLSGLPYEDFKKGIRRTEQGQYIIGKINHKQLEILPDKFEEPGVERTQLVSTPNVEIICRFIYPNEDRQKVMKSWARIEGLDLT